MTTPLIELDGLTQAYGGLVALSGLTGTIPQASVGLVGANGAGKSTLIKVLLGILKPTAGTASILGLSVTDDTKVRIESDDPRILGKALLDVPAVVGIHFEDGGLAVETSDLAALGTALPALSIEQSVRVTRFEPVDASLESVFRHLLSIRR